MLPAGKEAAAGVPGGPGLRPDEQPRDSGVEVKPPIAGVTRLSGPLPHDPVALWSMVMDACQSQHRMRLLVGNLKLVSKDDQRAVLEVSEEMRTAAQSAERDLCTLLSVAWGQQVRVELTSMGNAVGSVEKGGAEEPAVSPPPSLVTLKPIGDHPLIRQAMELFGAKVISTQARRKAGG